jgi:hypothetical protein
MPSGEFCCHYMGATKRKPDLLIVKCGLKKTKILLHVKSHIWVPHCLHTIIHNMERIINVTYIHDMLPQVYVGEPEMGYQNYTSATLSSSHLTIDQHITPLGWLRWLSHLTL